MQTRRDFITQAPAIVGLILGIQGCDFGNKKTQKRILLRSSWQTVNIGDIGHTPGVLTLLEKYLPDVEVRLWASHVGNGVKEMLLKRFPDLEIFTREDKTSLERAYKDCDFFLHGSGPYLVASGDVADWVEKTGKPYGALGITYNEVNMSPKVNSLLTRAEFVLFRDSFSLEYAKSIGINSKVMSFGPDGAFAADVRNAVAANSFLSSHGLEKGKFMCVIPKYRFTPYWLIPSKNRDFDKERDAVNQANKEHDHLQLRNAIIALIEQTEMKVLIIPEDETQVAIGKEMLFDPLPENIKEKVVWRDKYWLTDEALSTYEQSAGIFGNEQHSPIMCIGMGIPAIVCRWEQQTSKGVMWRDIGLGDWLFDMDTEADVAGIVPAVLAIAQNNEDAKAKALKAKLLVESYQKENLKLLESEIEKV